MDENQPETPVQWLERQYDEQAARMAEPSGRSTEEWAAQAERILAELKERAGQPAPDGSFRNLTVAFTSDEVILLSNVLRRQEPGGLFTGQAGLRDLARQGRVRQVRVLRLADAGLARRAGGRPGDVPRDCRGQARAQ